MRCNNCGHVNEDDVRFCIMCGQPIESKGQPEGAPRPSSTEPDSGRGDIRSDYYTPAPTQSPSVQGHQPPAPYSGFIQGHQSSTPYSGSVQTGYPVGAPPPQPGYRPPMQPQSPMTSSPSYGQVSSQDGWQKSSPSVKPPRKKKKKGLIIGLSILSVLIALVAAFLIYSLPLRPEVRLEGIRQTLDGTISKLSLQAKSNQMIREIRYALNPSDPTDPDAYKILDNIDGGIFEKTGILPKLSLDRKINKSSQERGPWARSDANAKIGNHTLYITLKTMFGTSDPIPFNLHYASGISSPPDRSKIRIGKSGDFDSLSNELLISLTMDSDRSIAEQLASETGGKIVGEIPSILRYQIRYDKVSSAELDAILETLRAHPSVEIAQYNYVYKRSEAQFYTNDAKLDSWDINNPDGNNWGLEVIRAPLVWKDLDGFTPISIGVADGGIEYDHEDLGIDRSKIYLFPTYTMETLEDLELYYTKSDKSPGSRYYRLKEHGTHVTGIISELGDNGIGATGVNWNTVPYFYHYWHMSVNEDTGELDLWNVTTSFELEVTLTTLVEQGCRVINFSVGDSDPSEPDGKDELIETQAYGDLCLRLESLGYDFLVFKAAGNEGMDAADFEMNRIMMGTDPGRRHTVMVASIENTPIDFDKGVDDRIKYAYRMPDYSNYGTLIDIAAPGSDIFSTVPGQGYDFKSGTSMASPMAAGVASLIYGAHPEYYASQVKAILMERTDTFTTDGTNIIPVVNAALSADYAKTGDTPLLPPGQVIPNPAVTPYPGPPQPTKPGEPGVFQFPGHTPFRGESGKGGFTGFVCDADSKSEIALFTLYLTDHNGELVTLDYTYPYPASYDAQKMGEFFTRVLAEDGQDTTVADLVIEAIGYKTYEVPPFTVRGGEVTDLGKIYLEPESEDVVRIPGHTPFTPRDGWGGFVGFVYDDETKTPISDFWIEVSYRDFDTGEPEHYTFEYTFPPAEGKYAQLQGEYMILVDVQGTEGDVEDLTVHADGYVSVYLGDFNIKEGLFTDAGVVYLKREGTSPGPEPQPQPVEPDPDDGVIRIPGHTPFTPREGCGGFAGFVYDAVTKKPIPSFSFVDLTWLDGSPADYEDTYFDWPYPDDMLAQIEGEFIFWVGTLGESSGTMEPFTIEADGYVSVYVDSFVVKEGAVTDLGVFYLQPLGSELNEGEIAVILEWGPAPEDLDLHVTAPIESYGRPFHLFAFSDYVYYGNPDYPDAWVEADSDLGYGPEAVILSSPEKDVVYTVYVHDFTNTAKQRGSYALANSDATVLVYFEGDSEPISFDVPYQEGTLWKVCEIRNGKVTPINTMSYEGRPLNIGTN
ncbi:MAG: S8 family serine peptidase [Clostridiaceae bacterium]|nr:S8 family serine peptidase [Clostridiaceae bacterium]